MPLADNDRFWAFDFGEPTSVIDRPARAVPPGQTALLVGVDGRIDHCLRRYPGNLAHSAALSITDPTVAGFSATITRAEYFEITCSDDATKRAFGYLVSSTGWPSGTASRFELWYRLSSDSSTTLRSTDVSTDLGGYTNGDHWSLTTRGKYIYFANGTAMKVVSISTTPIITVAAFGADTSALAAPTLSTEAEASVAGLIEGNYHFAYRYKDVARNRLTSLSKKGVFSTGTIAAGNGMAVQVDQGTACPSGYNRATAKVEIFGTLSSQSLSVAAGGSLYKIYEGFVDSSTGVFQVDIGRVAATTEDDGGPSGSGDGNGVSIVSDPNFPYQYQRIYDVDLDEVAVPTNLYGILHHQDVTYGLTITSAYVDLIWSPTHDLLPEQFPSFNIFRTRIPASLKHTLRLVKGGDYVYLFGGEFIYRVQRVGNTVAVTEVYNGMPLLHRDAILGVGSEIWFALSDGVYRMDTRTANVTPVAATMRFFQERWLTQKVFSSSDTQSGLRMGYDSRMKCVYVYCPNQDAALCVWLTTGTVSLLVLNGQETLCTGRWLEDDSSTARLIWFGHQSLCTPNYLESIGSSSDRPLTMSGMALAGDTGFTSYNPAVVSTGTSGSNVTITVAGTNPFKARVNGVTSSDVARLNGSYLYFLTGAQKGEWFQIKHADTTNKNKLVLTATGWGSAGAPAAGDVFAISPVVFGFVGAPLWVDGSAYNEMTYRRKMKGLTLTAGRFRSGASGVSLDDTAPVSTATWGVFEVGCARSDDLDSTSLLSPGTIGSNPSGAVLTTFHASKYMKAGTAIDTVLPENNMTYLTAGGTQLFPAVLSAMSNCSFEVYQLLVSGAIEPSQRIGS